MSGRMSDIEKAIESMVLMTQECFTPCFECGSSPVAEFREEELKKFAKEHPECVQYQREMRSHWQGPYIDRPDWLLVQPAICFIGGVCCSCCEENHKDVWDKCEQAKLDYMEECRRNPG